ncbi:ATP synthase F1 subunit delta [Acidobacteriota bacterium]
MKKRVLVKRYALGFLKTIKDEKEYDALYQELLGFHDLLTNQEVLRETLFSPFLPTSIKVELARDILTKASYQGKILRFILLLIENGRFEFFPEMLESLPEFWNELKGVSTYEVISVVPLNQDQKRKLTEKLESLEEKPVFLKYRKDSSLIGGISVQKGNVIYDASVKGNLERLKQLIIEG